MLEKLLDQYLEIMVKLITGIDRERKAAETSELFCHYIAKKYSNTV